MPSAAATAAASGMLRIRMRLPPTASIIALALSLILAHHDQVEIRRLVARRDRRDHAARALVQQHRLPRFLFRRTHALAIDPTKLIGDALHARGVVVEVRLDLE